MSKQSFKSPYIEAGFKRREDLFKSKKKRDTSLDGICKAHKRLQKKRKKGESIYFGKNEDNDWRFY